MSQETYRSNRETLLRIYPHLGASVPETAPEPSTTEWLTPNWSSRVDPDAELHIAAGFTSSNTLHKFVFEVLQLDLSHPRNRRVLLIDYRPENLCDWLATEDWTSLIDSERCLIHMGDSLENAIHMLCGRYPPLTHASTHWVHVDPGIDAQEYETARSRYEAIQNDLRNRIQSSVKQSSTKPKRPFAVSTRWFCPGHNAIQDACVDATQRLGYEAIRLQWKAPLYRFIRNSAWMTAYQQEPFDTAVFMNATPVSFTANATLGALPVHRTAWFVDHPRRYIDRPEDLAGCDRIGVFDRTYIPMLREWTSAPVVEVRTGIGVDWTQAVPDESLAEIDIAFVGELGTRGFLIYEDILQHHQPELMNRIRERFFDLDVTTTIDCETVFAPLLAEYGITYSGVWIEYIENRATALRRRFFLESLVDDGLRVFGDAEWGQGKWSGTIHPCWTGRRIEYRRELPRLYASAKVNINLFHVQCQHSLNPRVYDVLACGGFLLTQDNPALSDEFRDGEDLVVFRSKTELIEKTRYYLSRPHERARIAASGQQRALAKCKYDDRIPFLYPARNLPSGDRYAYLCG